MGTIARKISFAPKTVLPYLSWKGGASSLLISDLRGGRTKVLAGTF